MEKKSLKRLVGETIGFAALVYPIFSAFSSLTSSDLTFGETLKDPETAVLAGGLGTGYFLFHGTMELFKRYKISKRK